MEKQIKLFYMFYLIFDTILQLFLYVYILKYFIKSQQHIDISN